MSDSPLKLYGYWRSSASWRLRWALRLKDIPFEYVPVNILKGEHLEAAHLARNPLGILPVVEPEKGMFLCESLAIFEWLEESFPHKGPSLFPGSPLQRARIRSLCEIINAETAPLQTPRALKRHSADTSERTAWATHFIGEGLRAYESLSRPLRGEWSVGDQLSAADLCLVPQIYNAHRYGIDMTQELAPLERLFRKALGLEACQATSPERQSDAPKT